MTAVMAGLALAPAYGQELGTVRTDYMFKHTETPMGVHPYSTTVFTEGEHTVATMRGDDIFSTKNLVTDMALNPAGNSFAVITKDKKGKVALEIYGTDTADHRIHKFNTNDYGYPTAVAFSADARELIVTTDKGIYEFEVKKFKPLNHFSLSMQPTAIAVSDNGYFLAMTEGSKVGIYNLQTHTMRTTLDLEEPVNDATFSDGSDMLAVVTADGVLNVYDTRNFTIRTSIDDLGEGLACAFNDTGKYISVATSPTTIKVINLVRTDESETVEVPMENVKDLAFIKDSRGNTLLAYTTTYSLGAKRMLNLEPYYARLVSDRADEKMAEWLKMMPGETMEAYQLRMENQAKQRRLFEDELSTEYAGDMLSMATITLGNYDRGSQRLEVDFSNMPTIFLEVPQEDVVSFTSPDDLEFSDARYGLTADDNFELIYAKIRNKADGKTYVYDNLDRVPMNFMTSDDNVVSLEVLRQQQMEEIKLQEIRQSVVEEAKHANVISDHTHIAVDSRVEPTYNANGDKILNYIVKFTYTVEPAFSASEDFGPGKYHVAESGAATSMLKIVKEAFDGDFAQYLRPGQAVNIAISGTADATPIVRKIAYDGSAGEYEDEPIYQNGQLQSITVTTKGGIESNEQLAFVRAAGVKDYLEKNINNIKDLNRNYRYNIDVSEDKGSEHRRITAEFTIVDAFAE